ncbi:hypothetical protein ACHAW5_006410 [Stephanodiscus triporus]|uniref:Uncharacterized protein n=1 Tax=Stephanodiscus triporus TaxID=2934178 RepID=A0ABD3NZ26_9STRA
MTYQSRGRTVFEVVLRCRHWAFLVGFITVLCIGNYFRAKRAQERQKQRREAKMAATVGYNNMAGVGPSNNNNNAAGMHGGIGGGGGGVVVGGGGGGKGADYEAPVLPHVGGAAGRLL